MTEDQNNTQQVKLVSPESETGFTFPSQSQLANNRIEARKTMRQSSQFRWAMFITELQVYRRRAEQMVRDGKANTPAEAFWYQSDTVITTLMYLAFYTLSGKTRVRSDLEKDLAVSKPFLRRFTSDGIAGGHFDKNYVMSATSIELFIKRVDVILDMPALRDMCDAIHVMGVADSKAAEIVKG